MSESPIEKEESTAKEVEAIQLTRPNQKVEKNNPINWRGILTESGFIVFSILLALLINEWRSNIQLKNQKQKVMNMIVQELERNKKSLEQVAPYHKKIHEKLEQLTQADTFESAFENMDAMQVLRKEVLTTGIGKPSIQATAWNAAQLSNTLNLFDDQTLYLLSSIYELQEDGVEIMWKEVGMHILSPGVLQSEGKLLYLKTLSIYLGELQSQEFFLIEEYEKTLKAL